MRESAHPTRDPLPLGDAELLGRLREGDAAVLREAIKRYLPALRLYAERILRGSGDPEEAVQEAFIRLWTHRERWRGEASIRSLLFTITRNVALDELRRHWREVPLSETPAPLARSESHSPLHRLQEEELRRIAEAAISRLPPRRQEVFRLVREGGLTYREVAQVLDLSLQTVANLMSLALGDLRASLGPILGIDLRRPRRGSGTGRSRLVSGSD
jgi:RNA polymerase sigma-70 factor (ECF subfamily)